MTYEKFLEESLSKGLLRKQKADLRAVEKLILRAYKDLKTAKANLDIDKGLLIRWPILRCYMLQGHLFY